MKKSRTEILRVLLIPLHSKMKNDNALAFYNYFRMYFFFAFFNSAPLLFIFSIIRCMKPVMRTKVIFENTEWEKAGQLMPMKQFGCEYGIYSKRCHTARDWGYYLWAGMNFFIWPRYFNLI